VLFGVAAGGSWYLQTQQQAKDADAAKTAEEKPGKGAHPTPAGKHASGEAVNKPVIRPAPTSDTERLTQLAAALQTQKESLDTKTKEVGVREKQMDIIHNRIKDEQKKLDTVRKEIQVELALVQEKLEQLEKQTAEGVRDRKTVEASKKDLERTMWEVEDREWTAIKQQVKTFEKMDPEAAASMVIQMVDNSKLDTAVKVLSQMRDRQAAAIFAEITKQDTKLPGQIFERMLTLKTPSAAAAPK